MLLDSKSICRRNALLLYRSLVLYACISFHNSIRRIAYPPAITLQQDLPFFSQTCSDPSGMSLLFCSWSSKCKKSSNSDIVLYLHA